MSRPRTYEKMPFCHFLEAAAVLGVPPKRLVLDIGFSSGAHGAWERADKMPKTAAIACIALAAAHRLQHRAVAKVGVSDALFIVRVPPAKTQVFSMMMKGAEIEATAIPLA
jgi:hypothetical protein